MNCQKCGNVLVSGEKFCRNCGQAVITSNVEQGQINKNVVNPQPVVNNQPTQSVNTQPVTPAVNPTQQLYGQMNNNINSGSNNNQPNMNNSNNKLILIVGGVIGLLLLIAIVVGVFVLLNSGDKKAESNENNSSNENKEEVVVDNTYRITFKGFEYRLPNDIVNEINGNQLLIENENSTWGATIATVAGSYEQTKRDKSQLRMRLESMGVNVKSNVEVKEYSNQEMVTIEVEENSLNFIVAYTKIDDGNVAAITVVNNDNTFDYKYLDTIGKIFSSAKYVGTSNNIEFNTGLNDILKNSLSK